MQTKQLKASLQLAQMRLNADPSKANQSKYEQAKQAYELAQKSESQKIEQVSGKSENSGVPEDTGKTGDVAGDKQTSDTKAKKPEKPAKSSEPAAVQPLISEPSTISTSSEAVPAATDEQKKTDDLADAQA